MDTTFLWSERRNKGAGSLLPKKDVNERNLIEPRGKTKKQEVIDELVKGYNLRKTILLITPKTKG